MIGRIKILFAPLLLVAGCRGASMMDPAAPQESEQAEVRRALQGVLDAAMVKDLDRLESFHLYGPKFTKFSDSHPARLDAEAGRRGERVGIGASEGLTMKAEDLKIDVFGGTAVATFILDYSFKLRGETVQARARSTLVFVKVDGGWKITHEHLSSVNTPP